MKSESSLNTNVIAFIALCNEYCTMLENCREMTREEFVETMLKQLPRIYIMATDLKVDIVDAEDYYLADTLEEEYYDSVRRNIETLMGEDDVYLEVFEEDMKYSDTPVSASISEGLTDIFQILFNFLSTVRDATEENICYAILSVRDEFKSYWSATLCNVLRALNHLAYNTL